MEWLDIVRGPVLTGALSVFGVGTLWRLVGMLRRPGRTDQSAPRAGAPSRAVGALRGIGSGLRPRREFGQATLLTSLNGYVFHLGLALIFFGYAPHIAFIQRLTGLSWPALPDVVMYIAAAVTIFSLLLALIWRLSNRVLQKISNADDKITWIITFLPLLTGMALVGESSATILARGHVIYQGPLIVHLLSLELLLIWFPFGKLMHAFLFFFSRGATGMRFSHRGVKL